MMYPQEDRVEAKCGWCGQLCYGRLDLGMHEEFCPERHKAAARAQAEYEVEQIAASYAHGGSL